MVHSGLRDEICQNDTSVDDRTGRSPGAINTRASIAPINTRTTTRGTHYLKKNTAKLLYNNYPTCSRLVLHCSTPRYANCMLSPIFVALAAVAQVYNAQLT